MSDGNILVAGGGPVGLATALSLHDHGIGVEVVERDDCPGTHSYALALHPDVQERLERLGVGDEVREYGFPIKRLEFWDKEAMRAKLPYTSIPGFENGLLTVGQDHLEQVLAHLLEARGVPVHWSRRMADLEMKSEGVEVTLEHLVEAMSGYAMARMELQVERESRRRVDYVVGADGHNSLSRRKAGVAFPKVGPTQSFAVFEFKTDADLDGAAKLVFHPDGSSVLWPLPGGYCRWSFEIDESLAEQFTRDKDRLMMQVGSQGYNVLEDGMLAELLKKRAPWFGGSIGEFRWRMIVRFEKRLADCFGKDRVWLAGDAAHLVPPVGMQSMNIGIREGAQLAGVLASLIRGEKGQKALDAYAADRQREWRSLLGMDVSLLPREKTVPLLREHAESLLSCLPASLENLQSFAEVLGMDLEQD